MIYFLTYFLLDHFDAPSIYFTVFWGVIVGEALFAILTGVLQAMNKWASPSTKQTASKLSSGSRPPTSLLPACWPTLTIGTTEMTEIGLAFIIGFMIGLVMRPKDKDLVEQKAIYDKKVAQYEIDLQYYKQLCRWHVEQKNGKASE